MLAIVEIKKGAVILKPAYPSVVWKGSESLVEAYKKKYGTFEETVLCKLPDDKEAKLQILSSLFHLFSGMAYQPVEDIGDLLEGEEGATEATVKGAREVNALAPTDCTNACLDLGVFLLKRTGFNCLLKGTIFDCDEGGMQDKEITLKFRGFRTNPQTVIQDALKSYGVKPEWCLVPIED